MRRCIKSSQNNQILIFNSFLMLLFIPRSLRHSDHVHETVDSKSVKHNKRFSVDVSSGEAHTVNDVFCRSMTVLVHKTHITVLYAINEIKALNVSASKSCKFSPRDGRMKHRKSIYYYFQIFIHFSVCNVFRSM